MTMHRTLEEVRWNIMPLQNKYTWLLCSIWFRQKEVAGNGPGNVPSFAENDTCSAPAYIVGILQEFFRLLRSSTVENTCVYGGENSTVPSTRSTKNQRFFNKIKESAFLICLLGTLRAMLGFLDFYGTVKFLV